MRCPNCKLLTSDKKNSCPKCNFDLRAKKLELGLSISEQENVTPTFTSPEVTASPSPTSTPTSTPSPASPKPLAAEPFAAVEAIASATLKIDNAIQEVSKKSARNQASFEALPIVIDDLPPEDFSEGSGGPDNLLFEEPVAALEISDDDLDILLSTTSQLESKQPPSKKDMLSSLLTQAALAPAMKPKDKVTEKPVPPAVIAAAQAFVETAPVAPLPVAKAEQDFEVEFEIELPAKPTSSRKPEKQVSTWEIEHSAEAIEKLQQLLRRFNEEERFELFNSVEELTGFNLAEAYPEVMIIASLEDIPEAIAGDNAPVDVVPIEAAPTNVAPVEAGPVDVPSDDKFPDEPTPIEPIEFAEIELEESILDDSTPVEPEPVEASPEPEPVSAPEPVAFESIPRDLPVAKVEAEPNEVVEQLWQQLVNDPSLSHAGFQEITDAELLNEPERRFIEPLFERLLLPDAFDPNVIHLTVASPAEYRRVENSELQNALTKFVKEEEAISHATAAEVDDWTNEPLPEFGKSYGIGMNVVYSAILGLVVGIGSLFLLKPGITFSVAQLLISIIQAGSSNLMFFALLSVSFRILFWSLLVYPFVRLMRASIAARTQ